MFKMNGKEYTVKYLKDWLTGTYYVTVNGDTVAECLSGDEVTELSREDAVKYYEEQNS